VTYLYQPWFLGGLTPLFMHMVSELAASLLAWSRLAWDIFLRAVVISSNELMIINSGYCFLLPLGYYPLAVFLSSFCLQVPKEKKKEKKRKKERKKMCSFRN
jgi:hypothetical protein